MPDDPENDGVPGAPAPERLAPDGGEDGPDVEALQSEVAALRSLLAHISAGKIDIDAELETSAVKRDGTVVHLSAWRPAVKVAEGEGSRPEKARPTRPAERRGAPALRPSVKSMNDEELASALSANGMKQFHQGGA